MDKVKGCTSCEAGYYSAGGTVDSCTKCDADKYSASGATTCTDCPSAKGVASGEGKQESDCTWSKLCVQHQIIVDGHPMTLKLSHDLGRPTS